MKDFIVRSKYLERIKPFIGKALIKVFVGQRRVGKSYLMYQVMDEVRRIHEDIDILYINKELNEFDHIISHVELHDYVKGKTVPGRETCLFIDEVQTIENFELAVRSLLAEGNYDIYITGSNANLLSGELATHLGGRYIEIKVHPLSYPEFLVFHQLEDSPDSLELFLRFGGLPYLKNLPLNDEIVFDYLQNIYQSILYRDVVSRYEIRNVVFLNKLLTYLASNSGTLVSARNISNYLKSQKTNISTSVVITYLEYLNSAFITHKVNRTDIQGKKVFEIGEKHYFSDIGIRNAIAGFKSSDMGLIVENAVFNHLNSLNYSLLVGKSDGKEIDFIAEKHGEKMYIQACYMLGNEHVIQREFGNLLEINDQYPKYVVSMDKITGSNTYQGIMHLSLREFLTRE